jgi:heme/copper-type cytochrome/quinol oxidase subunit 3
MKMQFFKKSDNFKKKSSNLNPNFYWGLTVFITFLMMILAFLFGYYLFTQINQESPYQPSKTNQQIPVVDKNRIEKVLNYFSEREQKSKEILNSPASVVDPSI